MNEMDLKALEVATQTYAEFDSRKSGLATALGGVMALVMTLQVFSHTVRTISGSGWRVQAALIFLLPVFWLPLKEALFRLLYRDLGPVKALPEAAHEQRRWRWIFAIAVAVVTFQTLVLLGFVGGFAEVLRHPETAAQLPSRLPSLWTSWLWVAAVPWLYLLLAPWWIKGVEEARAYLVLVGQGLILIAFSFNQVGANLSHATRAWLLPCFLVIQVGVFVWAILTIKRGVQEHLGYLALLRSLPRES